MPKNLFLYCEPASFNWFVLPELQSRLAQIGLQVATQRITITRYPTAITYDTVEEALIDVRANGEPKRYNIWYRERAGDKRVCLRRSTYLDGDEFLQLELDGVGSMEDARTLADFLGLRLDSVQPKTPGLEKKCFIAHRFDDEGGELADKLARFLTLLNFEVSTGRGFSPGSVSEKVRGRMAQQSMVVAILTAGDDSTWLTQESLLASLDKPLFLLKEKNYSLKPGLLGDQEYIPFTKPTIETTFIQILEGLRNLGYKF
jgi:hypothetical protein